MCNQSFIKASPEFRRMASKKPLAKNFEWFFGTVAARSMGTTWPVKRAAFLKHQVCKGKCVNACQLKFKVHNAIPVDIALHDRVCTHDVITQLSGST